MGSTVGKKQAAQVLQENRLGQPRMETVWQQSFRVVMATSPLRRRLATMTAAAEACTGQTLVTNGRSDGALRITSTVDGASMMKMEGVIQTKEESPTSSLQCKAG
jgi:hypothetical protein